MVAGLQPDFLVEIDRGGVEGSRKLCSLVAEEPCDGSGGSEETATTNPKTNPRDFKKHDAGDGEPLSAGRHVRRRGGGGILRARPPRTSGAPLPPPHEPPRRVVWCPPWMRLSAHLSAAASQAKDQSPLP